MSKEHWRTQTLLQVVRGALHDALPHAKARQDNPALHGILDALSSLQELEARLAGRTS